MVQRDPPRGSVFGTTGNEEWPRGHQRVQLRQVASGFAAGYEPYQLYAQAVQARNAMVQADATYRSAWKQLAAAVGQPNLPFAPLVGRADAPPPSFSIDDVKNDTKAK